MNEGTCPFPRRCGVLKAWTALITAARCNVNAKASAVVQARAGAELYSYIYSYLHIVLTVYYKEIFTKLECGPMPNVMAAPAAYRWRPLFNAAKFG